MDYFPESNYFWLYLWPDWIAWWELIEISPQMEHYNLVSQLNELPKSTTYPVDHESSSLYGFGLSKLGDM